MKEPVVRTTEDSLEISDSASWEIHRRPVTELRWSLIVLLAGLVVGGAAVGLVVPGFVGFLVGLAVGVVATVVGFFAVTKVIRIDHG